MHKISRRVRSLFFLSSAGLMFLILTNPLFASSTHWGYSGHSGPEHWGELSPDFSACGTGKNQSPIDLSSQVEADLPQLALYKNPTTTEILNNGHTVQINFSKGNVLQLDGIDFELLQIHFHTPSENHITGKSYPMEAHLVHAAGDGQLAVISVMYVKGKENPALAEAWQYMPKNEGDHIPLSTQFATGLFPESVGYYRFNGSLTTPPCSEGVRWIVLSTPLEASAEQIETFSAVMKEPNNRPLQPVNARMILK